MFQIMRVLAVLSPVICGMCALAFASAIPVQGLAAQDFTKIGPSGLPLPRFVSLKSDRVNVRKGPSREHAVAWVFSRAGLPVEVTAESEHWRRVRDSEGTEGWIFHRLLSGRRTALVLPWAKQKQVVSLYSKPATGSTVVARLVPGVLGSVLKCTGGWCEFSIDTHSGWIEQEKLWGVYRGEEID